MLKKSNFLYQTPTASYWGLLLCYICPSKIHASHRRTRVTGRVLAGGVIRGAGATPPPSLASPGLRPPCVIQYGQLGGSPVCPASSPDSLEQRTSACVPGAL
ncbi:hypothetical protein ACJJTC_000997 [Scirpophaga incertulas]